MISAIILHSSYDNLTLTPISSKESHIQNIYKKNIHIHHRYKRTLCKRAFGELIRSRDACYTTLVINTHILSTRQFYLFSIPRKISHTHTIFIIRKIRVSSPTVYCVSPEFKHLCYSTVYLFHYKSNESLPNLVLIKSFFVKKLKQHRIDQCNATI